MVEARIPPALAVGSVKKRRIGMAKTIKFIFDGCDNNFAVEAPADITLAQLLKQADRMHIYG